MKKERCCSILKDAPSTLKVIVADFKNPCFFYHKKGEEFLLEEMVPEGMCPDLFFHIYPQYLSLLYDGKTKNPKDCGSAIIRCPGIGGKTYWWMGRKKLLLGPVINIADRFFRFMGIPKDLIDKRIFINLQKVEGSCPKGYSRSLHFIFNQYSHIWKRRFFCPAVFYTIYPFLRLFIANSIEGDESFIPPPSRIPRSLAAGMKGVFKSFPRSPILRGKVGGFIIQCPDDKSSITFKIVK